MPEYNPDKNKPGRKPGDTLIERVMPKLKNDELLQAKVKILELLSSGEALTISEAAQKCGIPAIRVYQWGESDPDFREMTRLAREVRADALEGELSQHNNFIPKMFILKGYRPMFRENYKAPIEESRTREIMEQLLQLAREGQNQEQGKREGIQAEMVPS